MKRDFDFDAARARVRAAGKAPFDVLAKEAGLDPASDFRFGNFARVDFAGADLWGFDFSAADLRGCGFHYSKIAGARFDKAILGVAPAATSGGSTPAANLSMASDWEAHVAHWRRSDRPTSDLYLPRHTIFRDAPFAPEMVVIPRGRFRMGSPPGEPGRYDNEGPQREVTITTPFAMGRFAVTFDEYDRFCAETGVEKPGDEGWGRGRWPAINVAWNDAHAYCQWLREETGSPYRLPSEAEWEYAARAGSTTPFWWGASITPDQANYHGNFAYEGGGAKGVWRKNTEPVDAFEPNPWGLYQIHGNVLEWCDDVWNDNYDGAPADGSAWTSGDKSRAVVRGGSWYVGPQVLRSAYRDWFNRSFRSDGLGFRVSRTLVER